MEAGGDLDAHIGKSYTAVVDFSTIGSKAKQFALQSVDAGQEKVNQGIVTANQWVDQQIDNVTGPMLPGLGNQMKQQVDTVSSRAKQQVKNMGAWTKTQVNRAGDALRWAFDFNH